MNTNALFNIGYGLYVITTNENGIDNGCILNSVMQVTSDPCRIAICINKGDYTCSIIQRTKKFNISVLTEKTKFDLIKRFGYQSGSDVNKFIGFENHKRTANGVTYITENTNAYIIGYVEQEIDLGTHVMFISHVVDAEVLSNDVTLTYDYYQKHVKPAPTAISKKGWRCKICGFIYEGEELPLDYVCPICKHGSVDFERV